MNYSESKNTALALHDLFFNNNGYYECLKKKIIQIIKNNNEDDQQVLFRLTKSLLTELMNGGYSLKYVDGKVNLPPHGKQFFHRTVRTFFSAR